MKLPARAIIVLITGFALFFLLGEIALAGDARKQERDRVVAERDTIYSRFLLGDVSTARQSLELGISCVYSNLSRIPGLTSSLPVAYARLSLLERRLGNEAESRIAYEKARYWRIVDRERAKVDPKIIVRDHEAFTRDECDQLADEWDKKWTNGAGPAYIKHIKN